MTALRQVVKIVALGLVFWSATLLWPEINQVPAGSLTVYAAAGLTLLAGLAAITALVLGRRRPVPNVQPVCLRESSRPVRRSRYETRPLRITSM